MLVNRLKSLIGAKPKTQPPPSPPEADKKTGTAEPPWITTAKLTIARYPKTFLGMGLIAGVTIGWLIKRR